MFNSEIFMLYVLYYELYCDLFIESGIDNGISTERFLKFVDVEYLGMDLNDGCYGRHVNKDNFTFTSLDSKEFIPKFIEHRKNRNIVIMIDGPKNKEAIDLKNKLLENTDVKIVAVHDTYDGLDYEDYLRIFETKNNKEYYEKYFDILNLHTRDDIKTIFNLRNYDGKFYNQTYPCGPGVSIYSKLDINFIL